MLSSRAKETLGLGGTATRTREAMAKARAAGLKEMPWISLAVAENKLMEDLLRPKLEASSCMVDGTYYAESWLGQASLRQRLAQLYNNHVLRNASLSSDNVAVLASATAAIDLVLFALCDEGDAVLTPAPYYGSYRRDVEARARCRLVPVVGDRGRLPSMAQLEASPPAKVLLLSNPQNPVGTVADEAELRDVIDWARRRGTQVVVDEVFALSVFGADFTSALDLADDVHVVYSMSKDFAISGFRIGAVFSRSAELMQVLEGVGCFASPGVPVQLAVDALLEDDAWLRDVWIPQLRSRLRASYESAKQEIDACGLRLVEEPTAGHFCLLDLGLPPSPGAAADVDADLSRRLFEAGVILTPGAPNMGLVDDPGFFRLCHAGHPAPKVSEGIRRIATLF